MDEIIKILEEEIPHQIKLKGNDNEYRIHLIHIAKRIYEKLKEAPPRL